MGGSFDINPVLHSANMTFFDRKVKEKTTRERQRVGQKKCVWMHDRGGDLTGLELESRAVSGGLVPIRQTEGVAMWLI
ncbi:MAG: hypothetical protein HQL87_00125 [Magnetococcales bacterium]|nr:hypothetical protein [Magnetococcales bacterium]